ncbi:unnamed protein product, partial [Rotaria magnacalcarata]
LRTIKAEVIVTCEYNGEEIYKYTWSNASFYCDPSESFDIKRNYVISNFLKSYISSSRDRLLSCPSLTITLQIRPMCDASGCDDLRLIKVRNGNTIIDEPSFTYQWVIDDFNTKTKTWKFDIDSQGKLPNIHRSVSYLPSYSYRNRFYPKMKGTRTDY